MYRNASIVVLIIPTVALCASIPNFVDTNNLLQGSVVSPTLSYPKNSSAVFGNTSFENVLKLRCDPVPYGRNPKVESCRKVFDYMTVNDIETVFADRSSGQPHDLNLPFRVTSNDARCYVQPILAEGADVARATLREIGNAAYTVFQECVVKHGTGGIAGDIGGDNKLNVFIASYKPNVRCNSSPGPPLDSCISIYSEMYVDKYRHMFGHLPDERVQIQLPITYTSADRRCMMEIDIKGSPTELSMYEVWEAMVALTSTCARGRQKSGKITGLGIGRNIYLQLSDEDPDAIQPLSVNSQNFSLLTSN